jgi:hypothetical protein
MWTATGHFKADKKLTKPQVMKATRGVLTDAASTFGLANRRRSGPHEGGLLGVGEQVQRPVGDHPLGRLDAPEQEHGAVRRDLVPGQPAAGLAGCGGDQ